MQKIIKRVDKNVAIAAWVQIFMLVLIFFLTAQIVRFDEVAKNFKRAKSHMIGRLETKKDEVRVRQSESIVLAIRTQAELTIDGIKKSIINYFSYHKGERKKLLVFDKNKNIIFSNKDGEETSYIKKEMKLEKTVYGLYNIYDGMGKLLIKNSFPKLNKKKVNELAKITSSNFKLFGNTGDTFWYVPNTLEIIFDNSLDCTPSGEATSVYLSDIPNHPNNKNPEACRYVIDNKYKWALDSDINSNLTFFFSEPSKEMIGEKDYSNNFRKFNFGNYNREFQARRLISGETIGLGNIYGIDLKIVIVIGAQEHEVARMFKSYYESTEALEKTFRNENRKTELIFKKMYLLGALFPMITAILACLTVIFSLFALKNLEKKVHLEYLKKE